MAGETDGSGFRRVRGSQDPRAATCRGKLQYRRAKLNHEINKQMMLRTGAEKLYKATDNKKLRETVALELSYVNSNLQLLKEQLAELNSSVHVYQNLSSANSIPMIPLGLKETKEIDFKEPFQDFILEHYSEDATRYEANIQEFSNFRQATRFPSRDYSGVKLLFEYYNLLQLVDRRFFPLRGCNQGLFFEWFDSLTGAPSKQRTIAFEKASTLFNAAALHTQIAAKQERNTTEGAEAAVDGFLRAAGVFRFIRDNFSNAPSTDLSSATLDALVELMLAQARECLFEKIWPAAEKLNLSTCFEVVQEAMEASATYDRVHRLLSVSSVKDYVPCSWVCLALVKSRHHRALAHHLAAASLLDYQGDLDDASAQALEDAHARDADATCIEVRIPRNAEERRQLGRTHLREALVLHEESLRLFRLCRPLRQADSLAGRLRSAQELSLERYASTEREDVFQEALDPPPLLAATKLQLTLTPPDFSLYPVRDPFHELGPLIVFSSRREWSAPRSVHLRRTKDGFGFSVRGDSPVIVASLEPSVQEVGLKEGDFVVGVGTVDAKWMCHEEVVSLVKTAKEVLHLRVVSPSDHHLIRNRNTTAPGKSVPSLVEDSPRRISWSFFRRRSRSKDPSLRRSDCGTFRQLVN